MAPTGDHIDGEEEEEVTPPTRVANRHAVHPDRALHDHPWVSLSIVLKGGFIEHMPGKVVRRRASQIVFRRAVHTHRIELFRTGHFSLSGAVPVPAWTLFITGPRIRKWGFHCPKGWVHWRDFTSPTDKGNIGKGCGE